MAVVLLAIGTVLVAVGAGGLWSPFAGALAAGLVVLALGWDAARDVLPPGDDIS